MGQTCTLTWCLKLLEIWKEPFGGEIFMANFSYLKSYSLPSYFLKEKRISRKICIPFSFCGIQKYQYKICEFIFVVLHPVSKA